VAAPCKAVLAILTFDLKFNSQFHALNKHIFKTELLNECGQNGANDYERRESLSSNVNPSVHRKDPRNGQHFHQGTGNTFNKELAKEKVAFELGGIEVCHAYLDGINEQGSVSTVGKNTVKHTLCLKKTVSSSCLHLSFWLP
jgi:hypothetical protein